MNPKLKPIFIPFIIISILTSCNAGNRGIFAERTAREKYEDKIEKIESPEVLSWKQVGENVLRNPVVVRAPYAEKGLFSGDSTDTNAFLFSVTPGQKILLIYQKEKTETSTAFLELWDAANSTQPRLIKAADTLLNTIEYSATYGGNFLVRMQPTLYARGSYHLNIAVRSILDFPIPATVKNNIGSFWGADRDAGARKHEGIDIFAKKGSPVLAVSNGMVRRVADGGIGGKTIWFNPDDEEFSVYYAHLDTQYVQNNQRVSKGQVIGTVGNTGNAQFTPAHLHLGIYTNNGAVDPLAFVQPVKEQVAITGKKLNEWYKPTPKVKFYPSPKKQDALQLSKDVTLKTVSATHQFYRVISSDGKRGFVPINDLSDKMKL